MAFDIWVFYLLAIIGLSFTPGPNSLLALSHGALYGARRSTVTIFGGVLGFVLLMGVSMAGMGTLLLASAEAFTIAKWIGAAYLVYLGIKAWRAAPPTVDIQDRAVNLAAVKRRSLLSQGFFAAVSNPKVVIFYAAFLPQFINTSEPQLPQFIVLAGTFAVVEFSVELMLAGSATRFAPWLSKGSVGRWFNRATGATFVGIGGILLTVNRHN